MTSYTLGIIGASGKFGSRIFSLAKKETGIDLVLGSNRTRAAPFIPVEELFEKSDVIIDASSWESTKSHIDLAIFYKKPLLIGTTGYPFDIETLLQKPSETIPVFYASNFSVAVTLLAQVIKKISTTLPAKHIELHETHHQSKKDTPSGTALFLSKHIAGGNPLEIISHRIDKVVFEHQVSFFYEEEEIVVTHKAFSRDVFAKGALLAAFFLQKRTPGLYHMHDLLSWLQTKVEESSPLSL